MSNNSNNSKKLESPAADRNKEPIWNIIKNKVLLPEIMNVSDSDTTTTSTMHPNVMNVLEIASGSGIHTHYFAKQLHEALLLQQLKSSSLTNTKTITTQPSKVVHWYPSDTEPNYLASIEAYVQDDVALLNSTVVQVQLPPLTITLNAYGIMEEPSIPMNTLQQLQFHLIVNINMIHISPWETTIGLMKVVQEYLHPTHGILLLYGPFKVNQTYCESNRMFDMSLRQRNNEWGIRDLEDVIQVANEIGTVKVMEVIEMPANNLCILFRKQK